MGLEDEEETNKFMKLMGIKNVITSFLKIFVNKNSLKVQI